MIEELVITEDNFHEHFFDVRRHKPTKGQVIACYRAVAEFVAGNEKRNVLDLLSKNAKAEATAQVMRKLLFASEQDAYKVPKEMCADLLSGMTEDEVMNKPYKYTFEAYYYTNSENIPVGDPHWSAISLINLDKFLTGADEEVNKELEITATLVEA